MSGICGMINFDGAPVDPALLRQMAETAAYRGPDGIRYYINGGVGMAHLALHTTPESQREQQPLVDAQRGFVMVADARLDNRDELIPFLTSKGFIQEKEPTDADLLLAAYACWGENCPEQILGDFAFAVWDAPRQVIFAARDRAGVVNFYYWKTPHSLFWATEACQLLAHPDLPARINEEMVAHDLVLFGYGGRHETYFEQIFKLGRAEKMVVNAAEVRINEYWDLSPDKTIRYKTDEEYVAHFGALLRRAVQDRLRSARPVGVFMSGGLDSTSMTAVAADILSSTPSGLTPELRLSTWDLVNQPAFSESERSRAVAERWNLKYTQVPVDDLLPLYDFPQGKPHRDEPFESHLYGFMLASFRAESGVNQPRTWLFGHPGDVITGIMNLFYYWDTLQQKGPFHFIRILNADAKLYGISIKKLVRGFLLQKTVIRPMHLYLERLSLGDKARLPDWIPSELAQRTRLVEWVFNQSRMDYLDPWSRSRKKLGDPARDLRYRFLKYHQDVRIREWTDRLSALHQATIWSPYDDSRLWEFVLAIPQSQISRGINHKLLLRGAVQGLLPDSVRLRRGLRTGVPMYLDEGMRSPSSRQRIQSLLADNIAARKGYLVIDPLIHAFEQHFSRKQYWGTRLWFPLCLERWLRTNWEHIL